MQEEAFEFMQEITEMRALNKSFRTFASEEGFKTA